MAFMPDLLSIHTLVYNYIQTGARDGGIYKKCHKLKLNKHELFLPKLVDLYDRNEIQIPPRIRLSFNLKAILFESPTVTNFRKSIQLNKTSKTIDSRNFKKNSLP